MRRFLVLSSALTLVAAGALVCAVIPATAQEKPSFAEENNVRVVITDAATGKVTKSPWMTYKEEQAVVDGIIGHDEGLGSCWKETKRKWFGFFPRTSKKEVVFFKERLIE